ncbi:MAG: hypothetical protein U0892_14870 [Pirellulales bacterium]
MPSSADPKQTADPPQRLDAKWHQPIALVIVIHFAVVIIGLMSNLGPSPLFERFQLVTAPYAISLHQQLGFVPLDMTQAGELDQAYDIQVRAVGDAVGAWKSFVADDSSALRLNRARWKLFLRNAGAAAVAQDNDLLADLFVRTVETAEQRYNLDIAAVRIVRRQALPEELDRGAAAGELVSVPIEYGQKTLFEADVVRLENGFAGIVPKQEPIRSAKAGPSSSATDSSAKQADAASLDSTQSDPTPSKGSEQ